MYIMLGKCLIVIAINILLSINYTATSSAQKNYGTFNLSITQFDLCKGPKSKECAFASANISGYSTLQYEITVLKNISPTKGKIIALSNGKEFLRLQLKKPCEHLFLRPLFAALLNVTDDCFVVKGHYKYSIDIQTVAQSYFGGSFIFGDWTFKSVFYSDDCNFSCSTIQVTLFPKKDN